MTEVSMQHYKLRACKEEVGVDLIGPYTCLVAERDMGICHSSIYTCSPLDILTVTRLKRQLATVLGVCDLRSRISIPRSAGISALRRPK